MRHVKHITKYPEKAQSALCSNLSSDYQVLLCFLLETLQTIFPSFADSKTPTQTET